MATPVAKVTAIPSKRSAVDWYILTAAYSILIVLRGERVEMFLISKQTFYEANMINGDSFYDDAMSIVSRNAWITKT